MRRIAVASFLFLAACSKSNSTPPTADIDAPPFGGAQTYTVKWGPVTVPAGTEKTQCVWATLDNATEIKVHELHNSLTEGSHHLIVYKDEDPNDMAKVGQPPVDCQAFTGALNASGMIAPMMITQKMDDDLKLPEGVTDAATNKTGNVGYTLAAHQLIKLELHYINRSDSMSEDIGATVNFVNADPSTIVSEADILFIGSPDIGCNGSGCTKINPGTPATLHQFLDVSQTSLDLTGANFFAITGHEHQWGTGVTVNVGAPGGSMTPVYNPTNFSWSEPVTQVANPAFQVGAGQGFDFTCTWLDQGSAAATFGESANNEMCFFWAYYYPSKGAHVCIHTNQAGGASGTQACCPGDGICSLIHL